MTVADWATLMDALRILSPVLGGWGIYLLRQLSHDVRTLTTDVAGLKYWQSNHDQRDDDRFEQIQRQVNEQRERLGVQRRATH